MTIHEKINKRSGYMMPLSVAWPLLNTITKPTIENDLSRILRVICDYYKEDIGKVRSRSKKEDYMRCRRAFYYFGRLKARATYALLGRYAGGFDHATVMYHVRASQGFLETNKAIARDFDNIQKILEA